MTEHSGIYIGLSRPFEEVKLTRKEQRDLRNQRKAFKASAKKCLADAYGVPADSLSVHIKSNGVDAFPIKMQSVHDFLNQTVTENAKEWENDVAAYQDIRHILDAIQKDVENAYKGQKQMRGQALDAYRAYVAEYYGVPEENVDAYYSEAEHAVIATITVENEQPSWTATLWE